MKVMINYNVTSRMLELCKKEVLCDYNAYDAVYVFRDAISFGIYRVLENFNESYDVEEGCYLVEYNEIDKIDFLNYVGKENIECLSNGEIDGILNSMTTYEIIDNLLKMDDDNGFENWEVYELESMEDAIDLIADGYAIETI